MRLVASMAQALRPQLWLACAAAAAITLSGRADPPPNIVLIVIDDAGYNELGYTGENPFVTPNIDGLAASGIRFPHGYVSSPVCSPSRAGLMTGLYQQRFGFEHVVSSVSHGFPAGMTTLMDRLSDLGYTIGYVGKWHVGFHMGVNGPLDLGAGDFFGLWGGGRSYWAGESIDTKVMRRGAQIVEATWPFEGDPADYDPVLGRYLTDAMGDEAAGFIDAHHADSDPFFLFLSFTAVHAPYDARQADLDEFPGLTRTQKIRAAMTLAMDRAIGKVLDALTAHGIDGMTAVVFVNDNGGSSAGEGEPRDNSPFQGWKNTTYEGGIRVPFVIRVPGLPGDVDYTAPVIALDLVPTLVGLAGGQVEGSDGVDLMPFLAGEGPGVPHEILFWRHRETWAVRQGNWKLVRPVSFLPAIGLYDVVSNPGETINRLNQQPLIAQELFRELTLWEAQLDKPAWHESLPDPYNQFDHFRLQPGAAQRSWSDPDAWYKGATTVTATMLPADAYADAILEFGADDLSYVAENDMHRMTGQTFMLNQLRFSGAFSGSSDLSATVTGNPLLFVASRAGAKPEIRLQATAPDAQGELTFDLQNELQILDDLEITGDGTQWFLLSGGIGEYVPGRSVAKSGSSNVALLGPCPLTGDFLIEGGRVVVTGAEAAVSSATITVGGPVDGALAVEAGANVVTGEIVLKSTGSIQTTDFCGAPASCGAGIEFGTLTVEIGPDGTGTIIAAGEAILGGTLNVVLSSPCAPPAGTMIEFLTAASVTGQFDTVILPGDVELSNGPSAVLLTMTQPGSPGDADCDGVVGVSDLLVALGAWGPCPAPCPPGCAADFNGDCAVNVVDLLVILANWG